MLTRIEIENYRSLRHVELEMKGLTVLIGPNGSGKSNMLDVFALMAEAAIGKLAKGVARRGGIGALLFRGGNEVHLKFTFDPDKELDSAKAPVRYEVALYDIEYERGIEFENAFMDVASSGSPALNLLTRSFTDGMRKAKFLGFGLDFNMAFEPRETEEKRLELQDELAIFQVKDQTRYPILYQLLRHIEGWILYQPIRVDSDAPVRRPQVVRSGFRLSPDGNNLTSVLHAIHQGHPAVREEIDEILRNAYEDFRSLSFTPEGGDGKILLRWWEYPFEPEYGFPINLLSDGTLRFLSLLAILKNPDPPPLICIEEPEIGLHPDWIKIVAELLESAATRTQIIVATHSPELVSHVQPEHVVVVEKENGQSAFARLKEDELSAWLDKFRLGDLWLSGEIGGRP